MRRPPGSGLEPARTIIELLGGQDVVAKLCGVTKLQIWRWTIPKEVGGAAGRVPNKHHAKIIKYAQDNKIALPINLLLPEIEGGGAIVDGRLVVDRKAS